MPIKVLTGMPGSGKSLRAARIALAMLASNARWYRHKKNPRPVLRPLWSNIKFSKAVEAKYGVGEGKGIRYWNHTRELVLLRDCDVLWDELAADLDAHDHASISRELKRFFAQHRKRRVRILGITQDFEDVDISLRRKTDELERLQKLIGSPDPSANMPPIRFIWGVTLVRVLDPRKYDKPDGLGADIEEFGGFPRLMFFSRVDVDVYDSYAEIARGEPPPLIHETRYCEMAGCDHQVTKHR